MPLKPLDAATRAAYEQSERNRVAQLLAAGIDPVTGFKVASPPPPASPTGPPPNGDPCPAGRTETPEQYEVRFEQQRQYQLGRLAAMVAARKAAEEGKGGGG
jgi:hypothetical protein